MSEPVEPAEKLLALRRVITDASKALLADVGDDDVAAINCVLAMEDALGDLSDLLGLVPSLLDIASLGPRVDERVAARCHEVERQHAELMRQRAALDADRELAGQLDQIKAEQEQIAGRIADLTRVKQITEELPALRATLRTLEQSTTTAQETEAEQVSADLTAAARALASLTERQRSAVGAELSAMTDAVETAVRQTAEQREQLADLKDRLAAQIAEAQELKNATDTDLPALQLHVQADAELVSGLDNAGLGNGDLRVDRVKGALADVAQRLADLDTNLRPLLIAHARAYEQARQIRR